MKKFKTINPTDYSTKDLHKILLSSVTPRPIALASTIDIKGIINLSPFSYFNVFSANPPVLVFSPANRVTDNSKKDTLININKVKEVVINLVNYNIVEPASLSSVYFEKNIDEFLKSGLTKIKSVKVKPPRVLESPVSFECKVNDVISLGNNGGAGNLVICEILMIHINEEFLNENGDIDPFKLNLVARMGENYYLNVKKESLFEIKKPVGVKAVGVDSLPNHAVESLILSPNDLARLANIEEIPSLDLISQFKENKDIKKIISLVDNKEKIKLLHVRVKEFLNNDDLKSAILTIFSI